MGDQESAKPARGVRDTVEKHVQRCFQGQRVPCAFRQRGVTETRLPHIEERLERSWFSSVSLAAPRANTAYRPATGIKPTSQGHQKYHKALASTQEGVFTWFNYSETRLEQRKAISSNIRDKANLQWGLKQLLVLMRIYNGRL